MKRWLRLVAPGSFPSGTPSGGPDLTGGSFHFEGFFGDEEKSRPIDSVNAIACDDQLTPNLAKAFDEPVNSFRRDSPGLDIPGTDCAQFATADPYDFPPRRAKQSILTSIGFFAPPHMLKSIAPGRVVLDGNPQFIDHNVGPDFVTGEERTRDPHRVEPEIHGESLGESMSQVTLSRRGRLGGESAVKGFPHRGA